MQRRSLAMALCVGLTFCDAHVARAAEELVYVGTFTFAPPAQAAGSTTAPQQGIYGARLDLKTGHLSPLGLAVELKRASWLITHPSLPIIYSVAQSTGDNSASDSAVIGFAIDPKSGALKQMSKVDADGRDATHMALDAATRTLFVANHGTGNVVALPLQADGALGALVSEQKDVGSGPTPRQKSAAAHGVAIDPNHRFVLVADFGADRIFVDAFDGKTRTLTPAATPFEQLPPGSGPRRALFHPGGRFVYVANELTGDICLYRWDGDGARLQPVKCQSAYAADYAGKKSAAEMLISRDGRFLYLSLRGDNEDLVAYSIDKASGTLTEIQRLFPQGKIPWSFGIDPTGHWMLVADQGSNSVAVIALDAKTGKMRATGESISIPNPVTVAFYHH